MGKMKQVLLPVALTAVFLAGCEADPKSQPIATSTPPGTGATSAAASTPTPAPANSVELERSSRGNLIKHVGTPASIADPANTSTKMVDFVVTDIVLDPVCTGNYGYPAVPQNGHFLAISMEVTTSAELAQQSYPRFSTASWDVISTDGTRQNASPNSNTTTACLPAQELLPYDLGPAEHTKGTIILDVASPEGILILKDIGAYTGWEWNYPAR